MTSELNVKVREATEADFDAIMAISDDIYGGLDYLPSLFTEILQDRRSNYFVAEIGEEVVGFKNCFLLDGNRTAVTMSARIKEAYQGIGLMKTLTMQSLKLLQARHPQLRKECYTSVMNDFFEKLHRQPRKDLSVRQLWGLCVHTTFVQDMLNGMDVFSKMSENVTAPMELTVTEAEFALTDNDHINRLFNTPIFVAGNTWTPCKVTPSNLREVAYTHRVTGTPSSIQGQWESIAFETHCETPAGMLFDIYYHGHSIPELLSHVAFCLKDTLLELAADSKIGLEVHFPEELCAKSVKQAITSAFGATRDASWPPSQTTILVERLLS